MIKIKKENLKEITKHHEILLKSSYDIFKRFIPDLIWRERCQQFMEVIVPLTCYMERNSHKDIVLSDTQKYMDFAFVQNIAYNSETPSFISNSLKKYLMILPDYHYDKGHNNILAKSLYEFVRMQVDYCLR
jgi:hypothetical protein